MIRIENLSKKYGTKEAVKGISLEVKEGEMLALLGVNGAGKTTTIKMLSCLTKPTGGKAEIGGYDVVKDTDKVKRLIGVSTQDTAIAKNLTVEENLQFMADIYMDHNEFSKKDRQEHVQEVLKNFKLDEIRTTRSSKLSGGWQRRLSIAMAIIGNPKVLFLDEPTLGLDVLARRELWKEIERLKKDKTIILTTHYMEEAEALADRIAIMIDGRIVMMGDLASLEARTGQKGLENVFISVAEGGLQ
ncbi:MAG: ABC transporter ATP-binding protein [Lachnospiraceae bacterium]|nr:ABC transporter ATP-binding protein [Lachnospiraceae bacterium]MBR5677504.1 ABC transporter ATP-binding protein [Paludibacteraceae bacterium]